MTTQSPARLGRWLAAGAALLALACLATRVVPLTLQNTVWAPKDPLSTLHRSTFSHVMNSSSETAVLFAGGTRALVTDNIWKNRRLFFIDLETGSRDELDLPRQGELNLSRLVYGGDAAYALYRGGRPDAGLPGLGRWRHRQARRARLRRDDARAGAARRRRGGGGPSRRRSRGGAGDG